ncbi:hypothetical protein CBS101457_005679 [Exobasidium rhododendri]|nr:hypothetical protein CBS101457_005679 [Exobasidium rhododendri]
MISKPFGEELLESILRDGADVDSNHAEMAASYFSSRVQGKRVQLGNIDRPRQGPKTNSLAHHQIEKRNERLLKKEKKTKRGHKMKEFKKDEKVQLSRRERQRLGMEKIDDNVTYESLLPVHQLWLDYILRLLDFVDENGAVRSNQIHQITGGVEGEGKLAIASNTITAFQTSLMKADLCGAPLRVTKALNPSLVGIEGLVARETEHTFVIVTKSLHPKAKASRKLVKVIPKQDSVFCLQIPLPAGAFPPRAAFETAGGSTEVQVPLYGNQFCNNMQTRATKKYKARKTIDL